MRKLFLILALILPFFTSWSVQADATITVTTTSDSITDDGLCSLREAVIAANTDSPYNGCPTGSGDDTILFSQTLPDPGIFTLNRLGAGEDDAMTGDFDLKGTLTITGQGIGSTILDGNSTDRVLEVHPGAHITLSGITVQNGMPPGIGLGGGILVHGLLYLNDSLVDSNQPGGILNDAGGLILNNVTISNNTAGYGLVNQNSATLVFNGGQVSGNQGGGIYNDTSTADLSDLSVLANTLGGGIFSTGFTLTELNVDHSLIENNTSTANGGGILNEGVGAVADISTSRITGNQAVAAGGGVNNNGILTITTSTLDQNQSRSGGGIDHGGGNLYLTNVTISSNDASDNGGGLYNRSASVLTNVTLSGNTADGPGTGGNIFNDTAQLSFRNSIVANSGVDGNCFNSEGAIHSGGHNLDSGNTCRFTDPSDLVSTPPMMGALQNNGGPTPTHALLETSPAINQGDDGLCPATDQRGVSRPQGAACDIGAYEFLPDSVANLAIIKTGTPDPVHTGELLTYSLSISNAGPDPAVLVTVGDALPLGVTFQSAAGTGWSCLLNASTVTCSRANMPVGTAADITIVVTAPTTPGLITNTANVSSASQDPVPTNNSSSLWISVINQFENSLFLPAVLK